MAYWLWQSLTWRNQTKRKTIFDSILFVFVYVICCCWCWYWLLFVDLTHGEKETIFIVFWSSFFHFCIVLDCWWSGKTFFVLFLIIIITKFYYSTNNQTGDEFWFWFSDSPDWFQNHYCFGHFRNAINKWNKWMNNGHLSFHNGPYLQSINDDLDLAAKVNSEWHY